MKTEVAKKNEIGEIVVADPFAPETYHAAANVSTLISSANARLVLRRKQFDDLGEIADAPLDAVKELRRVIEDDDAALKDFDGNLKNALLDLSGFKAYIVQTKGPGARIDPMSVRGKFAAMLKELREREDAAKTPEPTHTYIMQIVTTDADLKKIVTAANRTGAKYRVCEATKDKDMKWAERFFAEMI